MTICRTRGEDRIAEIRRLAESLGNLRVLHVNSTSYGGGVAELLYTIVPLMRDAGLDAEWHVIDGRADEFFDVTKKIHNSLQGAHKHPWAIGNGVCMRTSI